MFNRKLRQRLLVEAAIMKDQGHAAFTLEMINYRTSRVEVGELMPTKKLEQQLDRLVAQGLLIQLVPDSNRSLWQYRLTESGQARAESLGLQSA